MFSSNLERQTVFEALVIVVALVLWPLAVHYELLFVPFGLEPLDRALRESQIVQKVAQDGATRPIASLCQFKAATKEFPKVEGETYFMMNLLANQTQCLRHFANDVAFCDEQVARMRSFVRRETIVQLKPELHENEVVKNRGCATYVHLTVKDVAMRFATHWFLRHFNWLPAPLNPVTKYMECLRLMDLLNRNFPKDMKIRKEYGVPDPVLKYLVAGAKDLAVALKL